MKSLHFISTTLKASWRERKKKTYGKIFMSGTHCCQILTTYSKELYLVNQDWSYFHLQTSFHLCSFRSSLNIFHPLWMWSIKFHLRFFKNKLFFVPSIVVNPLYFVQKPPQKTQFEVICAVKIHLRRHFFTKFPHFFF